MIEAVLIYPIVFLLLFVLIFIGIYILQLMTMSAYAQKIAILAAREVSCPGYSDVLGSRLSTGTVEADFSDAEEDENAYVGRITIDNKVDNVKTRAYRYWSSSPLNEDEKKYYQDSLKLMLEQNSLMNPAKTQSVKATIECDNKIISQFVTVTLEQEMMDIEILEFFGVETPKMSVSAVATVSDTDELVRNTDFVTDAAEALAKRFGIDVDKIKTTVNDGLEKLGLKY